MMRNDTIKFRKSAVWFLFCCITALVNPVCLRQICVDELRQAVDQSLRGMIFVPWEQVGRRIFVAQMSAASR
jgi:hypothetical protein